MVVDQPDSDHEDSNGYPTTSDRNGPPLPPWAHVLTADSPSRHQIMGVIERYRQQPQHTRNRTETNSLRAANHLAECLRGARQMEDSIRWQYTANLRERSQLQQACAELRSENHTLQRTNAQLESQVGSTTNTARQDTTNNSSALPKEVAEGGCLSQIVILWLAASLIVASLLV
jgi:hypothetical protein